MPDTHRPPHEHCMINPSIPPKPLPHQEHQRVHGPPLAHQILWQCDLRTRLQNGSVEGEDGDAVEARVARRAESRRKAFNLVGHFRVGEEAMASRSSGGSAFFLVVGG